MSLTKYPDGISSFGSPVTPAPTLWLPQDAETFFISVLSGSDDNRGSYESPYLTPQQAVNQVPNTSQSTNRERGTMIYVNPGEYARQTEIEDRRYIRLIGAGYGLTILNAGASTGTTFAPSSGGVFAGTADNVGLVIAARSTLVTGFTIRGTASSYGIYIGDGGRRNSTWNYDASDCRIFNCEFDGDSYSGQWGIVIDGGQNILLCDNYLTGWVRGGIAVGSGISRSTIGVRIRNNDILACRGYGVLRIAGHQARSVSVGPGNVFSDDVTTALTNSVLFGTGDLEGVMGGNYDLTANGATGTATDRMGGNFETHAMNVPVYPAES